MCLAFILGNHGGSVFLLTLEGDNTQFMCVLRAVVFGWFVCWSLQSIKNGKYLAIKCMKNHFDSIEQVNNLREIQALRRLSPHPNIIKLYEVL